MTKDDKVVAGGAEKAASVEAAAVNADWKGMELEENAATKRATESESRVGGMFNSVFERLYGKMTFEEKLRLIWLAQTLFFIIGGYWLLRSLKDPVISTLCGVEYIPKAKMLSVVVVTVLVFVYNKLIDLFPKHQLFYIVGGFYATLFTLIAALLASPATSSFSILNTTPSPYRLLGWISYCSIESFGSIGVSLFWAFTNSTYNLEGAKKAYGLMVACAQLGSIAGPTLVNVATDSWGVPTVYFCGALCMLFMVVSIWGYARYFGVEPLVKPSDASASASAAGGSKKKKDKAGMTEGLFLFWKYHYVKGIFALSCLFMVEVTILDYSMKVLAKGKFDAEHPDDPIMATKAFASFMGFFGQSANGLSFCFSLVGTSFVIRRLGLNKTVILFPTLCLLAIFVVYAYPTLETVFAMMLVLKGLSYSLNNPCKEILYQPTSGAVKFKAKSWIDVFGARGSKALGSVVTNAFADSAADLLTYGSFVAMGVSSFLIYVSYWMGKEFDTLVDRGVKLGEEELPLTQTSKHPADAIDTSCGEEDPENPQKDTTTAKDDALDDKSNKKNRNRRLRGSSPCVFDYKAARPRSLSLTSSRFLSPVCALSQSSRFCLFPATGHRLSVPPSRRPSTSQSVFDDLFLFAAGAPDRQTDCFARASPFKTLFLPSCPSSSLSRRGRRAAVAGRSLDSILFACYYMCQSVSQSVASCRLAPLSQLTHYTPHIVNLDLWCQSNLPTRPPASLQVYLYDLF